MAGRLFIFSVVLFAVSIVLGRPVPALPSEEQLKEETKIQSSQPPSPTETKGGNKIQTGGSSNSQTPDDNSAIPTQPSVQTNLPVTPQSQPITTDSSQKKNSETSEDWRIVLFTGILTVVAVLQFVAMVFQSKYMRDQLGQMKTQADESTASFNQTLNEMKAQKTAMEQFAQAAARSADIAEQTLNWTQRAYLYIASWQIEGDVLALILRNRGNSASKFFELSWDCIVGEKLPSELRNVEQVGSRWIPPDAEYWAKLHRPKMEANTWLYIQIGYANLGVIHHHRIAMLYDVAAKRFVDFPSAYNEGD